MPQMSNPCQSREHPAIKTLQHDFALAFLSLGHRCHRGSYTERFKWASVHLGCH
ncbi:hypothetical protein CsSME_00006229 [Camellia sinensis var. sinensis]